LTSQQFWNEKRYHSLDYHLKKRFGEKVYKVSLDGGMTCPNRDGTLGNGGCIFCSAGGSGDFAAPVSQTVTDQINQGIKELKSVKSVGNKFIAYFQSFTNTYAPVSYLRKLFTEAIEHPDIVILSIATRPDCLSDEIIELLCELNQIKPVWIELGLQTYHDSTAEFIRRGYPLTCFEEAVRKLQKCSIEIIVHIIIGLPFESKLDLLKTITYLSVLPIQGVKLQLLHVLKNTDLADYIDKFHILTEEEYIELVLMCLEHLPKHIVVHRITGDGPKNILIAPQWSTRKKAVMNSINKALKVQDTWQSKYYIRDSM
jgi:radical SAM protein (TIGR01212 family)